MAGITFVRRREDGDNEDTSANDHILRGSVKQRIARFSNLVEMRSTANSGSRYGSKKKTINARRREQWRRFTRQQKKQQEVEKGRE